nr:RtcB family protein [Photorhabdus cinerea]
MWTHGVPVEAEASEQLLNTAKMPFIFSHLAVMPDVHLGKGSTIGSVIPTHKAITPTAVGIDIGCGLGNKENFYSCSHGAGRVLSRTTAKKRFTIEDQKRATAHVECRKDSDVIDEIPMTYKDIEAVMTAQSSLVEIVHTLRQVVCVKG